MSEVATTEKIAGIGDNNPPVDPPTPLQTLIAVRIEAEAFYKTLPGEPGKKKIETAEQASSAKALVDKLRGALKAADERRKKDNEPHRTAIATNDAAYKDPTTKADSAADALKKLGGEYLAAEQKKIDDARKIAEAEAAKARAEEERLRLVQENHEREGDVEAAAKVAEKVAEQTVNAAKAEYYAKPTTAKIGGGSGARSMSLRDVWDAKIINEEQAIKHYGNYPEVRAAYLAAILAAAKADAESYKDKAMAPAGVEFTLEKKAV